jgi:hypothetical protein
MIRFRILRLVLLCMALSSSLVCCGEDRQKCVSSEDCDQEKECLYSGNKPDDFYCLLRCRDDSECPPGQTCTGSASSCMACRDYIQVCE